MFDAIKKDLLTPVTLDDCRQWIVGLGALVLVLAIVFFSLFFSPVLFFACAAGLAFANGRYILGAFSTVIGVKLVPALWNALPDLFAWALSFF